MKNKLKEKKIIDRIENLERVVYRKDIEDCPRCKEHTMNYLQPGVCYLCAHVKGDGI